jgi:hypothetical protein
MDRVKFKVWDNKQGLWLGSRTSTSSPLLNGDTGLLAYLKEENPNYKIITCTGLKDDTEWDDLTEPEKRSYFNKYYEDSHRIIKLNLRDLYVYGTETPDWWAGKLVYEGDIISSAGMYVVEYDETSARFLSKSLDKCNRYYDFPCFHPTYKVIGNVYDNPELLEGGDW